METVCLLSREKVDGYVNSDYGSCSYIEYDSNDEQKIEVTPALMYYIPEGK